MHGQASQRARRNPSASDVVPVLPEVAYARRGRPRPSSHVTVLMKVATIERMFPVRFPGPAHHRASPTRLALFPYRVATRGALISL
jgi:hypothetical protein